MLIKAVFLDFGNVLTALDIDHGITAFHKHTGATKARVREVLYDGGEHGYSELFAQFERGEITTTRFFHLFAHALGCTDRMTFHEFAALWGSVFLEENAALEKLLSRIIVPKFLISNINELAYNRFAAECSLIKRHIPLPCNRILSCRVGTLKPNPAIYRRALAQADIRAHEGLLIDDLEKNIDGWKALGGHGIVYSANEHGVDKLESALAMHGVLA